MTSPRTIRDTVSGQHARCHAERKKASRKQRNQDHCIITTLWYGGWALILCSLTILLFITKVMAERLIFLGLIALGFVMLFYAVSWALILGTSFA